MHTEQCTLRTVQPTLHTDTEQLTLHTEQCTLFTVNCALYTVHCTVEREKTSSRFDWQRQREENIEKYFLLLKKTIFFNAFGFP